MRLNKNGLTLIEVLVALAIIASALPAIILTRRNNIESMIVARRMNIVAMLAKQRMIQAEIEVQGKPFTEVSESVSGQFDPPHQDYSWTREIKEVTFPNLLTGLSESGDGSGGKSQTGMQAEDMVTKYLSNSVRELVITVSWKSGEDVQSYKVAQYWVNLNSEMSLGP